jgi:HEAT repeat protein
VLNLLRDPDDEIRAQAAKVLGDAATAAARGHGAALLPLLADAAPRVRLQAAIAVGKFALRAAVEPLFALAEAAGDEPVLRHAAVMGLAGCADRADLLARVLHPSPRVRLAAVVALRRRADAGVADFLADADPRIRIHLARGEGLPRIRVGRKRGGHGWMKNFNNQQSLFFNRQSRTPLACESALIEDCRTFDC